jgi:hypothetical protein
VFVSCHFKNTAFRKDVCKMVTNQLGADAITGDDLQPHPTIRDGLIDRIRACNFFLAIWNSDGAQPCGDFSWPSTYLVWELGVAHVHKLNWNLLVSKRISSDAWAPFSERQVTVFDDDDFETQLNKVLSSMKTAK